MVPCLASIKDEPHRAAPRFRAIALHTSGELISELANGFASMTFAVAGHGLDAHIDGSLKWNRNTGFRWVGVLLNPTLITTFWATRSEGERPATTPKLTSSVCAPRTHTWHLRRRHASNDIGRRAQGDLQGATTTAGAHTAVQQAPGGQEHRRGLLRAMSDGDAGGGGGHAGQEVRSIGLEAE